MSLLEIIAISAGISLNVFSVVVCFGAVLLKIEEARLIKMIVVFSLMQVAAVMVGYLIVFIPIFKEALLYFKPFCTMLAAIIFAALGIFMIIKAVKDEPIVERLSNITFTQLVFASFITGIDALFAGIAFGLMGTAIAPVCLCTLIVTALVVILGLVTGHRLGYEHKTRAYAIGGVMLIITAVEVLFRYIRI